jgi:hypothetical protein
MDTLRQYPNSTEFVYLSRLDAAGPARYPPITSSVHRRIPTLVS